MANSIKKTAAAGFFAAAALLTTASLNGCSTTAGVEASGKTVWNEEGARELSKKVVFESSSLSGDLQVIDMQSALAGNMMRAQATLKSKDRDTLSFQYRFDWYDANGIEINSGAGSWKPLILTGRETKTVQSVAPDPRSKEFKLKIRAAEE